MCTVIENAMPMAAAMEGFRRKFSGWTSFEGPARPVETVMHAIVQGRRFPVEGRMYFLSSVASKESGTIMRNGQAKKIGENYWIQ